jgi:hypothetical protein
MNLKKQVHPCEDTPKMISGLNLLNYPLCSSRGDDFREINEIIVNHMKSELDI